MAIPAVVAEQEKKASEAHRAAYPDLYKESAADPTNAPAPTAPGGPAPSAPSPNGLPPSPQAAKGGEDIAALQHKLSVLQGKYNAEVPILQREANTLRTENATLRSENASLKTQPSPAPKEPGKPGSDASDPFKRIRDDYGDEFASNIDSAINSRVEALVAQRLNPMAEKINAVQTTQARSAEQVFFDALAKAVPKWMEINNNDGFKYWLGTPETFSGLPYQTLLESAHAQWDADRVARIFQAWPGYAGIGAPKSPSPDPNKNELESLIQPGPTAPNNQPTDANKKTYTQAQIRTFYEEVRRGLWKHRPKEQADMDMEIALASKEGRIVG